MHILFPSHCITGVQNKSETSNIPPGNMMLIKISYQIILILFDSILLSGFRIVDEVLAVFGIDEKFVECRSDKTSSCMTDMNYE